MDLAAAVNSRVAANVALTALIGTRYYWGHRDQAGALPAVLFIQVGRTTDYTLEEENDFKESRIQASCLGSSHKEAWDVAAAVKTALDGEASVSGFLFWEPDFFGPVDLTTEGAAGTLIHEAALDITLRHSAES